MVPRHFPLQLRDAAANRHFNPEPPTLSDALLERAEKQLTTHLETVGEQRDNRSTTTAAWHSAIQRLRNTVAELDDLPPDTPIDLREREFAGTDSIGIAGAELAASNREGGRRKDDLCRQREHRRRPFSLNVLSPPWSHPAVVRS